MEKGKGNKEPSYSSTHLCFSELGSIKQRHGDTATGGQEVPGPPSAVLVADSGMFKSPRFLVPKLLAGDGCKRCLGKVGLSVGWGQFVGLFLKEGGLWKVPMWDQSEITVPQW